jgi:hypothetical protein
MSELDRLIEEALDAEDRAILEKYGEQGLFTQMGGLFRGKTAWWTLMVTVVQIALFVGAVGAAVQFMRVEDPAGMLRWGGLAGLLMMAVGIIKLMLFARMQTNDILREVKRVELQIARLQARGNG